jgi:hypothetical protein
LEEKMTLGRLNDLFKGFVSTIINAILALFYPQERIARMEFEDSFLGLPPVSKRVGIDATGQNWIDNLTRLTELTATQKVKHFLRWDVIGATMFLSSLKRAEVLFLKKNSWHLYRKPIQEIPIGNPIRSLRFRSSGNLVHQAYHISQFLQGDTRKVEDLKLIVEFGGGYGCM